MILRERRALEKAIGNEKLTLSQLCSVTYDDALDSWKRSAVHLKDEEVETIYSEAKTERGSLDESHQDFLKGIRGL